MDETAVWSATENDLEKLGLIEKGHIICLKSFCYQSDDTKDNKVELAKLIKGAGQERTAKGTDHLKGRKIKTVHLGWLNYDDKKQKYSAVRLANGGGIRKAVFRNDAKREDILTKLKNLFFPTGLSSYGKLDTMNFELGNFSGETLVAKEFSLSNYIEHNSLSKTRLYLMTKKKSSSQIFREYAAPSSDSDFEDEKEQKPNTNIINISDDTDFMDSSSINQVPVHNLIGTSEERQAIVKEIENAVKESERIDKLKDKEKELLTEANSLLLLRKSRVYPEPDVSEDVLVISVRHPDFGTLRRIYHHDATMNQVYDWIGSKAAFPMHFKLFTRSIYSAIQPSEQVSGYSRLVLEMAELEEPLPFEEDNEITMQGFNTLETLSRLDDKRTEFRNNLNSDAIGSGLTIFTVDRNCIITDVFELYNKRIASKVVSIHFSDEDAVGDGVSRDVYCYFFKELYQFRCAGIDANVPCSLSDTEAERLGEIITHAFVQYNVFPIRIAKATFKYLIAGEVNDDTLLDSFLLYIDKHERNVVKKLLDDIEQFDQIAKNIVWDVLMDCGVNGIPTKKNFGELIIQAAKNVLIKKSFFILKQVQQGLGIFWKNTSSAEIDLIWNSYKPNHDNIMECFAFHSTSPIEEKLVSYLQRYLRNASEQTLSLMLQYCTGCSTIDGFEKIKVEFVNQDPRSLHLLVKACFKILYIPKQLDTFKSFKVMCDSTLYNSAYWSMFD